MTTGTQIRFYTPYFESKLFSNGEVLEDCGAYVKVRVTSGFMQDKETHVSKEYILS